MDKAVALLGPPLGGDVGITPTRDILARRNLPVLARLAASNLLLAFDYDGTLAPIVASPERARMRRATAALLRRVAELYPSVVISGRALADVSRRVDGIPLRHVFGNHGLEPPVNGQGRPESARWLQHLRATLPDEPGVVIEDKRHTVTVHYRAAADRRHALAAIRRALQTLPDARVMEGAEAFNILPRGGAGKGAALRRALSLFGCETALYVGDDGTDEDAFRALGPEHLASIRIGASRHSRARFHLRSQLAIDALLRHLIELRR